MSRIQPLIRIPIGVVVERRRAKSAWADFIWRPVAVLPGIPHAAPWTELESAADRTHYYGGAAEIELNRADASGYRDNLATGAGLLWVALRSTGVEPPYKIAAVTAEPSEGEALTENAGDIVDTVPMPELVRAVIFEFVAVHYVEHPFVKRQRDRADPEAMARRGPLKGRK